MGKTCGLRLGKLSKKPCVHIWLPSISFHLHSQKVCLHHLCLLGGNAKTSDIWTHQCKYSYCLTFPWTLVNFAQFRLNACINSFQAKINEQISQTGVNTVVINDFLSRILLIEWFKLANILICIGSFKYMYSLFLIYKIRYLSKILNSYLTRTLTISQICNHSM